MPVARKAPWVHGFTWLYAATALLGAGPARAAEGAAPETAKAPSSSAPSTSAPATPTRDYSTPGLFAAGTHFSLSWVRLQGAEECLSARELSRAVEARLHRPALGAPAESDVAIEGHIEPAEETGFHATVTITDAHGVVVGRRELDSGPSSCRDIDAPLALAVALMIDPDAAFAPSAESMPRVRSLAKVEPRKVRARPREPGFRSTIAVGALAGFGILPSTAAGAFVSASIEPPKFFPIEVDAHLWLDQVTSIGQDVNVAFTRATLGVFLCPLGTHIGFVGLGACAGLEAGTITAAGSGRESLISGRRVIVDPGVRGHADFLVLPHLAVRVTSSLGIPLIRDSFDYLHDDGAKTTVFRPPAANGEVGGGIAVELP